MTRTRTGRLDHTEPTPSAGVGGWQSIDASSLTENTAVERQKARLVTCAHAVDKTDALDLLLKLGLVEQVAA